MDFRYENKNNKINDFNLSIGKEWSKQNVKNQYLNSIFNMIDDGDGKLSEQEYGIFVKLLKHSDGINGGKADNVVKNSELKALLENLKSEIIKINDFKDAPVEEFDSNMYSLENIKKRYPEDKYEIRQPMDGQITVIDKKSGLNVLEVMDESNSSLGAGPRSICSVTLYDNGKEKQYSIYNAQTKRLESYRGPDGVSHDVLPEKLYADITKKKFGIFHTTSKDFESHLKELTKYNVEDVMASYEKMSGSSLISDILTERGLSAEMRADLAKQVIDVFIEARKSRTGDISGFKEAMYEIVDNEKDSLWPMSASKIEDLIVQIKEQRDVALYDENGNLIAEKAPNGKVDKDFRQGSTGDCWLLAAIKTIVDNPQTAEILNDQITANEDGSVTVNLKNVGKTYTFSEKELMNHKMSKGDKDVVALELSVEKYIKEEEKLDYLRHAVMGDGPIEGNMPNAAYKILLGKGGGMLNQTILGQSFVSSDLIDKIKSGKYLITVGAIFGGESDFKVEDNKNAQHNLYSGHAYAVKSADDEYVYIVNPWNTSQTIKVPTDKFISFFDQASVCEINEVLEKNKKSYDFGENAIVNNDGRVLIRNNNQTLEKTSGDASAIVSKKLDKAELDKIRRLAEEKYGNDYNIQVNSKGDILLTPLTQKS